MLVFLKIEEYQRKGEIVTEPDTMGLLGTKTFLCPWVSATCLHLPDGVSIPRKFLPSLRTQIFKQIWKTQQ